MASRLHIVVDEAEKILFQRSAKLEGKSLSAWIRDAVRERAAAAMEGPRLETVEALETFFANCKRAESGREPDWEDHLKVIEQSVRSGRAGA